MGATMVRLPSFLVVLAGFRLFACPCTRLPEWPPSSGLQCGMGRSILELSERRLRPSWSSCRGANSRLCAISANQSDR